MKKLFFTSFLSLFVLLVNVSCSSDDSSDSQTKVSTFSATLAGSSKSYNTVVLSPVSGATDNTMVTASVNGSASDLISFAVLQGTTGPMAIYSLQIKYNGVTYEGNASISEEYDTNITVNNSERIEGTFSGLIRSSEGDQLTVTNGAFKAYR